MRPLGIDRVTAPLVEIGPQAVYAGQNGGVQMVDPVQIAFRNGARWLAATARSGGRLYREVLRPWAEFVWCSASDLFVLCNTPHNRAALRRIVWLPLLKIEKLLEKCLPASMHHRFPVKTLGLLLIVLVLLQLPRGSSIADLQKAGELIVISRESPTTLYRDGDQTAGPDYDYLASFAQFLGVDLRVDLRANHTQVLDAIAGGEGHIGAAGMTFYPPLAEQGHVFGPGYQNVDVQVICRRNHGKRPRKIEDLENVDLVVVADSPYESRLFELQEQHPDLTWESEEDSTVDELLEMVWRKQIGCTIANSSEVNIKRRFYPELQVAFTIREDEALAWTLSPEWEILSDSIEQWLEVIENDGTLLLLRDRHYKLENFDYVDMRTFVRRMKSRLPRIESLFKKYAEQYGIPWTLLAAQSYQESHWNRRAKSPTGVRGIMMLTLTTAKEMGVTSRLDVEQSIKGGAKYLSRLAERIPDSVEGDDRWWYALAAYNVGMGHLHDARKLARELDLDPDSWLDLKGVLPLLSQKKYYKKLKYGYARGAEPVTYVRNIRNYQNIMHAQLARNRGAHHS